MYPQKSGDIYLPWVRSPQLSYVSYAARGVTWRTRDCHAEHVCLESRKPEWSNFFVAQSPGGGVEMMYVTSVRDVERECRYKLSILCPSCQADPGPVRVMSGPTRLTRVTIHVSVINGGWCLRGQETIGCW